MKDHPRESSINAEARVRFEVALRDQRQKGFKETGNEAEWEVRWVWEELAQMTTSHNWAIEETHSLGKLLLDMQKDRDLWKMEAEASAGALRELRKVTEEILGRKRQG